VDVLVTEATYGEPEYVFPDHDDVVADILDWLAETDDPVLLFGYALGRAQKLQLLAARAGRTVYTTDAVQRVNEAIANHRSVEFPATEFDDSVDLTANDALILPMTTARIDWIESLAEETGAATAGFSGWAIDSSFRFRGNFDAAFPLSDHCDFQELCGLIEAADPEQIYTQHGSGDAFAEHLTSEGYDARTIKQNQTTLGEF
jgi:putative mRNA 3-end processing factor